MKTFKYSPWDKCMALGSFTVLLVGVYLCNLEMIMAASLVFCLNWRCMAQHRLIEQLEDELEELEMYL